MLLLIVSGMAVIMRTVFALVFMLMGIARSTAFIILMGSTGAAAVLMLVLMLMLMGMRMFMAVFMGMLAIPMHVLMIMIVGMFMLVLMLVFVISFHGSLHCMYLFVIVA